MTLRDRFALEAPITVHDALRAGGWGNWASDLPANDSDRAAVMAVWVMLRYEFADEMIRQRSAK